jgi:hypothetical protein
MGPDALGTAENESERAIHENGSRCPRHRQKPVMAREKMKTGPDALDTAENESGRAKHENGTRHPQYRRK